MQQQQPRRRHRCWSRGSIRSARPRGYGVGIMGAKEVSGPTTTGELCPISAGSAFAAGQSRAVVVARAASGRIVCRTGRTVIKSVCGLTKMTPSPLDGLL
jgi:hypothetical protein